MKQAGARTGYNTLFFAVVATLACASAVYAYFHPDHIAVASQTAISALSIIFGLSTAITSILVTPNQTAAGLPSDPDLAKRILSRVAHDNDKTLKRQTYLNSAAIVAVIVGLIYLVAHSAQCTGQVTRLAAALFAFMSTVCLSYALLLPRLLKSLFQRNSYLSSRKYTK